MRPVIRRLRQLEAKLVPPVDLRMQRAAEILDERRRLLGYTPEPLDWASLNLPPGTRLNNRETLRFALQLRREQRARQVQADASLDRGKQFVAEPRK